MATVTTNWATYATQRLTWYDSSSGSNWSADVSAEAYYTKINDTSVTIHVREKVSLVPPSGYNEWYGTNKYYNVNGNGRRQDTASLVSGTPHYFTGNDFTVSAGSNFNISAYYEVMNSNSVTASATVTAPTFATQPDTPTVHLTSTAAKSVSLTYGTSSFGTPSTGTVYLYGGTGSAPTGQVSKKTTTGQSSFTHSNLTGNTRYYYRARATNGSIWSDYSSTVNTVTLAVAPTISFSSATTYTITMRYSAPTDGGVYTKTLQYSLNNSTWTTYKTLSNGNATSGTFTISNLTAGTSYTVYTRVVTTAGTTSGGSISVSTQQAIYAPFPNNPSSSSRNAHQVNKLYIPRNGLARQIIRLYDSVNGRARRIY